MVKIIHEQQMCNYRICISHRFIIFHSLEQHAIWSTSPVLGYSRPQVLKVVSAMKLYYSIPMLWYIQAKMMLTGVSSVGSMEKFCKILVMATFISKMANLLPIQFLGPAPKGWKIIWLIWDMFSILGRNIVRFKTVSH